MLKMVIDIILLSLAFVALVAGTITDIRKREVPDWINFGLIFSGLGLRIVYSSITSDWMYLIYGLLGFGLFVIIAYTMFYAGQWGGGDSKLLMGLGAVLGIPLSLNPFPLLFIFVVNALLAGALYGMVYSVVLAHTHKKDFMKNFRKIMHDKKVMRVRIVALALSLIFIVMVIVMIKEMMIIWLLVSLIILAYLSIYLVVFVKAVEFSAMFKLVEPRQLTEGDWIAKEYSLGKEHLCGPKDLGISKKQIERLIELKRNGKIDKIKIKEGIPFVPSFLIAYIVTMMFGAWWLFLL